MIINELRTGEKTVNDISSAMEVNQAVVSRHLAILRNRGVVNSRRKGTSIYYSLADPRIGDACDLVQHVLISQMERNRELAERLIDM